MADAYCGEIRLFAGKYAPGGWALCNGALLPISTNGQLYAVIGTKYGGDGINTFAVPDLRGRVPVGIGTGPGLSPYNFAQQGGAEQVTVTQAEMPAHSHALNATTNAADLSLPSEALFASTAGTFVAYIPAATGTLDAPLDAGMIQPTGGYQPHPNIMPSQGINYIISLHGFMPGPASSQGRGP